MAYLASQLFAGTSCEYGLSLLRTHAHSPVVASTLTAHCHIDYFTSLPSLACGLVRHSSFAGFKRRNDRCHCQ